VTAQLSVGWAEREQAQKQAWTEMLRPKGHDGPAQSIGLSLEHFEAPWLRFRLTFVLS